MEDQELVIRDTSGTKVLYEIVKSLEGDRVRKRIDEAYRKGYKQCQTDIRSALGIRPFGPDTLIGKI